MMLSEDALTIQEKCTIYYNDNRPDTRIRFSLMHELGHILLKTTNEIDANIFSSNILAPRIAINYSCKNFRDVMNLFGLSEEAANIAFDDFKRWRRNIVTHNNKMNDIDKFLYKHFYNKHIKKFVYKISECAICGRKIYNTNKIDCGICIHPRYTYTRYSDFNDLDTQLLVAENQWLYGE